MKNTILKKSMLLFTILLFFIITMFALSSYTYATTEENYEYEVTEEGTVIITKYIGDEVEVVIPSTIEGKKVTQIGSRAFIAITSVNTLILQNGIESIGENAFYNCKNLTTVTLPNGLESIGEGAFAFDKSLTTINFPEGLKNIGESAFYGCELLTTINFPRGLASIGKSAFYNCELITTIVLPKEIESIGERAFTNTSPYKKIYVIAGSYAETFVKNNHPTTIKYMTININDCEISEIVKHEYTGEPVVPNVIVKDIGIIINDGIDYEITCTNNINVGTATVEIEGKGNYSGTITKTFEIVAKNLSKITSTINTENKIYTGKPLTTDIVLKDRNTTLQEGTDYIVNYKNNINVGTATVEIEGKGNYSGKIIKNFKIIEKPISYKLGDINKDGKVDTKDARQALLSYVGKIKLTEEQKQLADVNKDGKVDTKDARQILLFYVGKIKNF